MMTKCVGLGHVSASFALLFVLGCEATDSVQSNYAVNADGDETALIGHTSSDLLPGGQLAMNQYLQSSNGSHRFYMQDDGNLVLVRMSDKKPLWASGTNGKSVSYFRFRTGGDLVLRTASGSTIWSSNTDGSRATKLHLHSDGRVVLYRDSSAIWSANGSPMDECPNDPAKTTPGLCGCGNPEGTCSADECPGDPNKTKPGLCGCGVPEGTCNTHANVTFPIRATFYYPWYPETWTVNGRHVFYHPVLGYYNTADVNVIDKHIRMMDYAKIQVAIISWWGRESVNEGRIPLLLERTIALGSPLKWAFYYEDEMFSNPSAAVISADIDYLKQTYGSSNAIARINGKPVLFVYNEGGCSIVDRWSKTSWRNWYVNMKVFGGFENCANQPDIWHQYGPDSAAQRHGGKSYVISPGFWKADKYAPDLARSVPRFYQNVRDMVASGEPWQLITTFNEWGEGTAVEPASEWKSSSGYGQYLDALHTDGVQ
ncbi:MAG: hypothetical protein MUF54_21345 [Polyangiaceae bacterium]|nr:hypothetical protein [Polyangiaceae bacterium]